MRYLKSYNIYESIDFYTVDEIEKVEEIFQELADDGFNVIVEIANCDEIDFSKSNVVDIRDIKLLGGTNKIISVSIRSNIKMNRIIETLIFAESYCRSELGIEIYYIYISNPQSGRLRQYVYYNSIDDIKGYNHINYINIAFKRI